MIKQHLGSYKIPKKVLVNLKHMGNIKEICYQDRVNRNIYIKKLSDDEYVYLPTGEIIQCKHIKNRSENLFQVSQSLKRLRDYINTNVQEPMNCRWITLTYSDNMTDTKRLYKDFKNFMKRLKYSFKQYNIEYIVAMEPQGRGAWHAHLILIFDRKAPYIPNKIIENLWSQGFTKTKMLVDIDNVGAYLTAYLGDMECTTENLKLLGISPNDLRIKLVDSIDGIELKKPKKFIKGGRLYLYPPKFNLYRCSRGIKKPISELITYENAIKKIGHMQPTFSSALTLTEFDIATDKPRFSKTIAYEFYNTKRLIAQD